MRFYFNIVNLTFALEKYNSIISSSLLKYGYSNFSVEILEYCRSSEVRKREQYYLDLEKPEYNILKLVDSFIGHKHPEDSLTKN